jgi:hypothetical protein
MTRAKKAQLAKARKAAHEAIKAKQEPVFEERVLVETIPDYTWVTLDCGCLVKILPGDPREWWMSRPLVVVDNDACGVVWDTEPPPRTGESEYGVKGTWKYGWKGSKQHRVASVIYDAGLRHGVAHTNETIQERFQNELAKDAD